MFPATAAAAHIRFTSHMTSHISLLLPRGAPICTHAAGALARPRGLCASQVHGSMRALVAYKHSRSDVLSCSLLLPPSEARARIVRESELDAQRKTRPICSNRPLYNLTCYDPDNAHSYTCVSTPPWGAAELSRLTRASGDGSGGLCLNGTRGRGACPPGSLLCRLHVTSLASGTQDVVAPSVAMPGVGDAALVSALNLTS